MTSLIGISGSLRRGSFNTSLLRAVAELTTGDTEITVKTLYGISLYDGDVEDSEALPEIDSRLFPILRQSD
jgi:NAD(P)H-dependent FMN reductase